MTRQARPSARCRALLLDLSLYLDGDLSADRRRSVERHLKTCECCGLMAANLRRTVDACRTLGVRHMPRAVRARAAARIRSLQARRRPSG